MEARRYHGYYVNKNVEKECWKRLQVLGTPPFKSKINSIGEFVIMICKNTKEGKMNTIIETIEREFPDYVIMFERGQFCNVLQRQLYNRLSNEL